jgi:hypothetical protein
MGFSFKQWILFAAMDWLIKSLYLLIFQGSIIIGPFMAAFMTAVHLTALCVIGLIINLAKVDRFRSILLPVLANVIFVGVMTWFWVSFYQSGSVTLCSNNECRWINGAITPLGVRVLAMHMGAYTALNLVTLLAAGTVKSLGLKRHQTPGSSEPAQQKARS